MIEWDLAPNRADRQGNKSKPIPIAIGSATSPDAGATQLRLKLTRRGRMLLRHANTVTLNGTATFAPRGRPGLTADELLKLRR
jgi:hypothetical protein